jgi:hypothetical protein
MEKLPANSCLIEDYFTKRTPYNVYNVHLKTNAGDVILSHLPIVQIHRISSCICCAVNKT